MKNTTDTVSEPSLVLSQVLESLIKAFPGSQKFINSKDERRIEKNTVAAAGGRIKDVSLSGQGRSVMIYETVLLFRSSPPR